MLGRVVKRNTISNNGWEAKEEEKGKFGYVATKANATFEFELKNIHGMVQTLNFMHMKSYGEKWDGSKLRVDVSVIKKKTSALEEDNVVIENYNEMTGFHDKSTSETYTSQLYLNDDGETNCNGNGGLKGIVDAGDDLRVRFRLIGGSTFKIMWMAFCDH